MLSRSLPGPGSRIQFNRRSCARPHPAASDRYCPAPDPISQFTSTRMPDNDYPPGSLASVSPFLRRPPRKRSLLARFLRRPDVDGAVETIETTLAGRDPREVDPVAIAASLNEWGA